jgi:type IV secretion system protein VirB10
MSQQDDYKIERKKPRLSRGGKFGMLALTAAAGAVVLYPLLPQPDRRGIETSGVEEFQSDARSASGFGLIVPPEAAPPAPALAVDFSMIEGDLAAQRADLEGRNAALEAEIRRLQEQMTGLATRDSSAETAEILRAMEAMQADYRDQIAAMQAGFAREISGLQSSNAALQAQLTAGAASQPDLEAQRQEEQRRAQLEARRAQQEAIMRARVASPGIVFDEGQAGRNAAAPGPGPTSAPGPQTRDQAGRDFVQSGLEPTPVSRSQVIANPSNTVLQGTMIQATLENAVDSSLPGQLTAIVNYPVSSFDGTQVLIPAGSRLFGQYSSDVSIGQGRILVGWTRLVTPDGQSVQMNAFGGDGAGRSGITGQVHSRFAMRFGSAALISLIGAAPAIAAARLDSEVASETVQDVTRDLGSSTTSVIEDYMRLPPVITVPAGAAITVIVDRDLEIY